jgi:hypothetical protein
MNKDQKREQAIAKIESHHALLEIYKQEKNHVDLIIDQALNYPSGGNHWKAYEALKKQASLLTGWHAARPELAESAYYNAMVDFIDYLLPEVQSEDEAQQEQLEYPGLYPELSRYVDADGINTWFENATLMLKQIEENQLQLTGGKSERRQLMEQRTNKMMKLGEFLAEGPND